ncbi:uncharacterized protein LOC113291231 [Papaver somniferum]|uniref:uncharacterized protein LOC113291231 n=1 Tax=Papaver somniferum TaxID=3469 RepID=UPI000E6F4FE3|nr:uncharacterized protein LOC113291231 [Papaver somniferum]
MGKTLISGKINNGEWNVSLIKSFFDDDYTMKIKMIEPNIKNIDKPKWIGTQDGEVTVGSPYNYLCNNKKHLDARVEWLDIWKLQVIPRVKMFMWKSLSDCLRVKERLGRHILLDTQCIMCNRITSERTDHLFLECNFSEAIWRGLSFSHIFYNKRNSGFKNWCLDWLMDKTNIDVCAYIFWFIWKYRCRVSFDGVNPNPIDLISTIKKDLNFFQVTYLSNNTCHTVRPKKACDISHSGCKEGSSYMFNSAEYIMFDAAFNKQTKRFAYALVLFDKTSSIYDFAGGSGKCSDSNEAEARACREAIRWDRRSGIKYIVFLNDNLNVINCMRRRNFSAKGSSTLPSCNLISGSSFLNFLKNNTPTTIGQFFSISTTPLEPIHPEISTLLESYADVFEPPTSLPPQRAIDHQITLKHNYAPISQRPY